LTPEGKVKKEVKAYLASLKDHCWFYMPVPMGYGRAGVPDFIGCYKGRFFSIETKAPGKKEDITAWQLREAAAIRAAGGLCIITDNAASVALKFRSYFNAL
jgi:hypothetical protein